MSIFRNKTAVCLPIKSLDYLNVICDRAHENQSKYFFEDVHFRIVSRLRSELIRYGHDKFNTYENIYIDRRYISTVILPNLNLSPSDTALLISKKFKLEYNLWMGNLYEGLIQNLLVAEDKAKAVLLIIKTNECAYYTECLPELSLIENLHKILQVLEDFHTSNVHPHYSKMALDLLKSFCRRKETFEWLLMEFSDFEINFPYLIEACRSEHSDFFEIWGNKTKRSLSVQTIDRCLRSHRKAAESFFFHGCINTYSEVSYQNMKEYVQLCCIADRYEEGFYDKFSKYLGSRHDKRVLYRILQVYFLYHYQVYFLDQEGPDSTSESVLRLLWDSSSDPLLDFEDFESIVIASEEGAFEKHVLDAWTWYSENMNVKNKYKKKPRSLKQHSKIVVRETLSRCYNYPDGISRLCIPESLKDGIYISNKTIN